jgi:hypothetical protein
MTNPQNRISTDFDKYCTNLINKWINKWTFTAAYDTYFTFGLTINWYVTTTHYFSLFRYISEFFSYVVEGFSLEIQNFSGVHTIKRQKNFKLEADYYIVPGGVDTPRPGTKVWYGWHEMDFDDLKWLAAGGALLSLKRFLKLSFWNDFCIYCTVVLCITALYVNLSQVWQKKICGFADQILFCDLRIWDVWILFFCRLKIAASSLFLLTNKDLKSSDLIFYQIKNSAKETYGQLLSSGFKH